MIRTFQTRLLLDADAARQLDAYAALYGRAERTLFARVAGGESMADLKPGFCARFGLTARQFNAVASSVKGKARSLVELRKQRIAELEDRLGRLRKLITQLPEGSAQRHEKRRQLDRLTHVLEQLRLDHRQGRLRLCFGGGKLFHAQYNLQPTDHAGWLRDWQSARVNAFFVLGSKDETAGCQGCQLSPAGDGRYRAKLRLPNALLDPARPKATHLTFEVGFGHGREQLDAALSAGTALSFRFRRDAKGWRLLVSLEVAGPARRPPAPGALGVDINADHLALTLMDGAGNPLASWRVALVTYGCSANQARARIGEAVKAVIRLALAAGVALVVERLDFQAKKRSLKEQGPRYARMLSSLAYRRILETLEARAFDAGIAVRAVNPAFTSVIGRAKFARRYGLSSHGAAALVIARRLLSFSERPNRTSLQVTSRAPARKRGEHVWKHWARRSTEERRVQRASGRREAIPRPPGAVAAAGVPGTHLEAAGGSPARKSVSSTVRGACHGELR